MGLFIGKNIFLKKDFHFNGSLCFSNSIAWSKHRLKELRIQTTEESKYSIFPKICIVDAIIIGAPKMRNNVYCKVITLILLCFIFGICSSLHLFLIALSVFIALPAIIIAIVIALSYSFKVLFYLFC